MRCLDQDLASTLHFALSTLFRCMESNKITLKTLTDNMRWVQIPEYLEGAGHYLIETLTFWQALTCCVATQRTCSSSSRSCRLSRVTFVRLMSMSKRSVSWGSFVNSTFMQGNQQESCWWLCPFLWQLLDWTTKEAWRLFLSSCQVFCKKLIYKYIMLGEDSNDGNVDYTMIRGLIKR